MIRCVNVTYQGMIHIKYCNNNKKNTHKCIDVWKIRNRTHLILCSHKSQRMDGHVFHHGSYREGMDYNTYVVGCRFEQPAIVMGGGGLLSLQLDSSKSHQMVGWYKQMWVWVSISGYDWLHVALMTFLVALGHVGMRCEIIFKFDFMHLHFSPPLYLCLDGANSSLLVHHDLPSNLLREAKKAHKRGKKRKDVAFCRAPIFSYFDPLF